ncbi:glycine betaine ABC transporter substrate-binding protein [Alkalibacter saccharofermentans]|uniref:Glycine betaine/proline transport system substrate-binding protein n=1 Tax=Alkalibacter saccharofermentans DSM 14828 TaxID=1120975 RepID=A0A1M4VL58_9FIRM|nr:glycine betaine ABC transporter substrate-binding protein [Alkalibacter saccharofermentans]SHE69648.1 glycine betaine/proline transport system substrate-binding protein [Alkalibacter saccharofermentans DSM 14828]
MIKRSIVVFLLIALSVFTMACGTGSEDSTTVELGYVAWDSEIASTNVLKTVLEDEGFDVNITDVSASLMYQGVAQGDFDGMVAAWLPTTQADYMVQYGDDLIDLGPNLTGTLIGLVVPADAPVNSIEDLVETNYADGIITGIEPGAGLMQATLTVIDSYGLDYELVEGSDASMTATLADAIDNDEEVIVTGWTPHWKFARWDLKYLEDPQGIFGGEEQIHTLVREGFEADNPEAFKIISNFEWTPDDMAEVMVMIADGTRAEDAARAWVDANPDKVAAWTE